MTGATNDSTPAWEHLSHLGLLRFAGADAASFLQGQLSNDTRPLATGTPLLAAYSTAQGRVVAILHLLPHSSGVMAILPRELAMPTLERLRNYVLRAKVEIEDLSDRFLVIGRRSGATADGLALPEAARGYAERDGIGVAAVASDANRYWAVGSAQDLARVGIARDLNEAPRIEHDWRLADIRAGLPQIYAATREMFVAQMLNLDLIDGISFTKGCFTGQEIIARTQHLGRIKRRLHRLRLPVGAWAVGQAVHLADGRSGRLTEVAAAGAEFEALAVLNLERGSGAAVAPDLAQTDTAASTLVHATELPLPYSPGGAAGAAESALPAA